MYLYVSNQGPLRYKNVSIREINEIIISLFSWIFMSFLSKR